MEFKIFNTVYNVIDSTENDMSEWVLSTIANLAREEIIKNHSNAWNNFEIALHAIDKGMERDVFIENIENSIGTRVVGVIGIDDRIEEKEYIIIAFDKGLEIECQSYAGDITQCDTILILDDTPTEEEMDAMYDDYIANYGDILDAKFINGAV